MDRNSDVKKNVKRKFVILDTKSTPKQSEIASPTAELKQSKIDELQAEIEKIQKEMLQTQPTQPQILQKQPPQAQIVQQPQPKTNPTQNNKQEVKKSHRRNIPQRFSSKRSSLNVKDHVEDNQPSAAEHPITQSNYDLDQKQKVTKTNLDDSQNDNAESHNFYNDSHDNFDDEDSASASNNINCKDSFRNNTSHVHSQTVANDDSHTVANDIRDDSQTIPNDIRDDCKTIPNDIRDDSPTDIPNYCEEESTINSDRLSKNFEEGLDNILEKQDVDEQDEEEFDHDRSETLSESILKMNKEEFEISFNRYYDRWITKIMTFDDPVKQFHVAMRFFSNSKIIDQRLSDYGYAIAIAKLQLYWLYLMQNEDNRMFETDELEMYRKKCTHMRRVIYQYKQAHMIISKTSDILFSTNDELENNIEKNKWRLSPAITDFLLPDNSSIKYNEKQKLHIRLLRQLSIRGYRKYGDYCYEEIKTVKGKPTHAWQQCCKIEDFVVEVCNRLTNPENWDVLTKQSKTGVDDMVEKLICLDDPEFPKIEKDRHKFSFRNGIFVTNWKMKTSQGKKKIVSRFFPYDSEDILLVSNRLASAKYHDLDFHDYAEDEILDWYDIPTPAFQKVLDHQYKHLSEQEYIDVCKWFYVHIGRLLFDIGELDNWQVMMYILGEPATGKSTTYNYFVQKVYDDLETGILDNNMESQFGLENLLETEKYVLIGQELDEKFKLERTSFLRIISGEPLMAARKNKMAVKTTFKCHMACCGNKMLGYEDNKGELKRRIIPFLFDYKVLPSQADPNLHKKLAKELPAILQKCVWAYIEYADKYGNQSIWNVLPKYFKQASQRVAERNNPRRAFLESNEIVYGEGFYVTETEFRTRFMDFCKQRSFGRIKFEFESWKSEFQDISHEKGIKIDVELRTDKIYPRNGGVMVSRENFIMGLDVKTDDFVLRNDD